MAESYKASIETGMAAGDEDATWAMFAQQMVADPANEALVNAIQSGTENVPEELKTAIDRAVATSEENVPDDPLTIEGIETEIKCIS